MTKKILVYPTNNACNTQRILRLPPSIKSVDECESYDYLNLD